MGMSWLIIGRSTSELTEIWKTNKRRNEPFDGYDSIKQWLPYIVKKELDPSLCINGSYSTLRLYVRMYENKELITQLPKIRQNYGFSHAYTHSLYEMNGWLRTFDEKVRMMAVQRDIPFPDTTDDKIELYKVYLEHHSHADNSDIEEDKCPTLDYL